MADVVLLLDTCGERGSVALCREGKIAAEELLPERMASATVLGGVRSVLQRAGLKVEDLEALGVVNGPGSFTGVRVGLAVAKGLCEANGLPLAAVSRLAVLAAAGNLRDGCAVLRAGRDQLYLLALEDGVPGAERMVSVTELAEAARGREVVYAEPDVAAMLGESVRARLVPLSAASALGDVAACLRRGGSELAGADANYVRDEGTIYRRAGAGAPAGVGGA